MRTGWTTGTRVTTASTDQPRAWFGEEAARGMRRLLSCWVPLLDEGSDLRRRRSRAESPVQRDRALAGGARSAGVAERFQGGTEISFDLGQRVGASLPPRQLGCPSEHRRRARVVAPRSEEHTSELQSRFGISY